MNHASHHANNGGSSSFCCHSRWWSVVQHHKFSWSQKEAVFQEWLLLSRDHFSMNSWPMGTSHCWAPTVPFEKVLPSTVCILAQEGRSRVITVSLWSHSQSEHRWDDVVSGWRHVRLLHVLLWDFLSLLATVLWLFNPCSVVSRFATFVDGAAQAITPSLRPRPPSPPIHHPAGCLPGRGRGQDAQRNKFYPLLSKGITDG